MSTPRRLPLTVQRATERSVSPYGTLIGSTTSVSGQPSAFYDGTVNFPFSGFCSDEDTTVIVSACQPRPLAVRYMERHFKHTQTFIPLGGRPFVMVLAPPNEEELPALELVEALRFDGAAGFMLKVGTWHEFPFALVADTDVVSILRQETYRGVSSKDPEDGEAHNPDLDKKDIIRRLGVEIYVEDAVEAGC